MNNLLREKLNKIVSAKNAKNWYIPELFEKNTLPNLPKELDLIEMPPKEEKNYNCFIYALGLHKNSDVLKETKGFIYSNFIKHLIEINEIKQVKKIQPNIIVLYINEKSNPNEFTHAGIAQENGKILSKWSWGPILLHDLFDTPFSYGNKVTYYKPIKPEKALELYNKYKSFNEDLRD